MADSITSPNAEPALRWKKAVIAAALVIFGLYASTHMVAAGDTWVALACGRHFAQHGVDTVEPFSFNAHPAGPSDEQLARFPEWTHGMIRFWHPTGWINQNWGTHLKFYTLATWFGSDGEYNYNTLVYWKYALFTAAIVVVFAFGKLLGAGDFLSMVAACCAMVIGRSFYDIRPACYSNLLVPLFILLLALSTYKHHKHIWWMLPLIVFWANVHGGYIYAYIMLTPFMAVHILLNLPRRWTLALGLSGLWLVLYVLYYKFHTNAYYVQTTRLAEPGYEVMGFFSGLLWTGLLLAVGSVVLASMRRVTAGLFYSYHILVTLIFSVVLLAGYGLHIPGGLHPMMRRILDHFLTGNIVGFLLLLAFGVLVIVLTAVKKERFVRVSNRTLLHITAAAGVSFLAMIVLNPFRLTNLTHTFEISISEHAASWRTVNEWRPAFDWMDPTTDRPNPVGDQEPFVVMCIVGAAILLVWVVLHLLKPSTRPVRKGPRHLAADDEAIEAGWPQIDLALILVGMLTMYMAVQSRRFIAIAGPSASPVFAMMMMQAALMIAARRQWKKTRTLTPTLPPTAWQRYAWQAATVVLIGLSGYWGWTYYQVYVAPWPNDDVRNSLFMRMTASHHKPFEVCDFFNDNRLEGRIFNYWTDGGGLAFGQIPDPATGQTPLQHFMDGRAQAAYDHDTFKLWQHLFSGGPIAEQILRSGKTPDAEQLGQIGAWLDEELTDRDVWIALMPKNQADSIFMRSLMATPNWKTAYLDETQHVIVNTDTEKGQRLIADILAGEAVFPDSYSESLTLYRIKIESREPALLIDVLDHARDAFEERFHPSAMLALVTTARSIPAYRDAANETIGDYLETFLAEQSNWSRKAGYQLRLSSAIIAAGHLAVMPSEDRDAMNAIAVSLRQEAVKISQRSVW